MTGAGRLESLLLLQDRDGALDRLQHRRDTLPERATLAEIEAVMAQLASRRRVLAGRHDELTREERRLGDEAGALHEKAAEVEAKMYSGAVSSPRELQAMQADVEQLRRHERAVEGRELEVMEALEPVDRDLEVLDAERAALDGRLHAARASIERSEAEIDREMGDERKARDAIAGEIDPTLVAEYERRRSRAQGVGVARLVGSTCQGCHLSIPATEVDRIRKSPEGSLQFCDNCGCILVP
jgi:predicted  nucleic acid-binding Zn-ribbon protein